MRVSKNFIAQEFISKNAYNYMIGRGLSPLWYINPRLVLFCEWLKEKCGGASVVINDWYWNGQYDSSGLRSPNDIGAEFSQHKFMNALDIKVKGYTPAQLRQIIVDNFDEVHDNFGITTIEKIAYTETWLHVDTRWTGLHYLLEVKP